MKAKLAAEFDSAPELDAPIDPDTEGTEDGRRLRRDRNRQAVVDALLELYAEGDLDPSAAEIAQRAGLSPRSLFRYFTDVDDLCRVAVSRQLSRVGHLADLTVAPDAPATERIAALVASRLALCETIGTTGTVARMRAHFQPVIAAELTRSRAVLRDQVADLFASELESRDADEAVRTVAAIDVLLSYEAHRLLRMDQGLEPEQVEAVWSDALTALLLSGPAAP